MHRGFYSWWNGRGNGRSWRNEEARSEQPGSGSFDMGEARKRHCGESQGSDAHHCSEKHECGDRGPFGRHGPWAGSFRGRRGFGHDGTGDGFGVRRPLRFLAYKLGLDENQVGDLARIIDALKTERAQAEVDSRRATARIADALGGATFDAPAADDFAKSRVHSAEQLGTAITKALKELHALLNDEQRKHLSHLVRTGILTF